MSKLYAGTSRIDITPRQGHNLSGWHLRREAEKCISPLLARTLVLDNGETRIVLVTCDLLAIQEPLSGRIRMSVADAVGTEANKVFIFPSHNHYAADISPKFFSENGIQTPMEKEYVDNLPYKLADCAKHASENMQAVKYGYAFGSEGSVLINDRFRREDGLINWVGDVSLAAEKRTADPQLSVISYVTEELKTIATVYHYGCHANCGEEDGLAAISWDWCGYASEKVENSLGGEAFFILGPCGDIHPIKYGIAKEMGEKVGKAVVEISKGINYRDCSRLSSVTETIELKRRDFTKYDKKQIYDFCSQLEDAEIRRQIEDFCVELLEEELKKPPGDIKASIGSILLGDVAISCVPGELFTELGMEIKQHSPIKPTLVAEIVNDWVSYIPAAKDYTEGGYQVSTVTKLEQGSGEVLVERCVKSIGKHMDSC